MNSSSDKVRYSTFWLKAPTAVDNTFKVNWPRCKKVAISQMVFTNHAITELGGNVAKLVSLRLGTNTGLIDLNRQPVYETNSDDTKMFALNLPVLRMDGATTSYLTVSSVDQTSAVLYDGRNGYRTSSVDPDIKSISFEVIFDGWAYGSTSGVSDTYPLIVTLAIIHQE